MRWLWIPMLALAAYLTVDAVLGRHYLPAAVYLVVGLGLSWWLSPWKGGRSKRHQEVMNMPEQDRRVVIYWRPGCTYCAGLRSKLGDLGDKAHWVNIWQDEDAAASLPF